MSNYGESYYLEELEEMQKEKVVTINPEKQVIIDKSGLDLIYKQISDLEAKLAEKEKEIKARDKRIDRLEEDYYQETRQLEWVNEQLTEAEKQLEKQISIHYGHLQELVSKIDQDKISFAIDILEELAGCSNYINSKLDFECGSYVSEKAIRDKIKYLKGKKDE